MLTSLSRARYKLDPYIKAAIKWRGHRRRWLRQAAWRSLGSKVSSVVVSTKWGDVVVGTDDDVIGQDMFLGDPMDMRLLAHAVELLDLPAKGVFLDVGANIGSASLAAIGLGFTKSLAFEPDHLNAARARACFALNGLLTSQVKETAVGDEESTVDITRSSSNSGAHRVVPGLAVRQATLDVLLSESGISALDVGLVWVDVQGCEPGVLRGAKSLLDAGVPWVIEFSPSTSADYAESIMSLLAGRKILRIADEHNNLTSDPITAADLRSFPAGVDRGEWDILVLPSIS